jgi:fibronectin type 3 domain-containing protein
MYIVHIMTDIFLFTSIERVLKRLISSTVPTQPSNLRASEVGETSVTLQWSRPAHAGENIVSYELYWNDTYAKVSLPAGLVFVI